MRQQAREWVVLLITILLAVPGLPYMAGLVGLWIKFFRPPYELSESDAWQAAWDVSRAQIYLYGIKLIWPFVPLSLFLSGFILLIYTIKSDTVQRKVRRRAWALMVIGCITWWIEWTFTSITVIVLLAIIAAFVYGLWSAARGPRQEGEDAGTPLPPSILISLGALYVAFIAYAVLHAPDAYVTLDYLVNKKERKVVGQVTSESEVGWDYIACKGNGEKYTSAHKRNLYLVIHAKTATEYFKKLGTPLYQPTETFPQSIFRDPGPKSYVTLCGIREQDLLILLGRKPPRAPLTSPYQSEHSPW